MAQSTNARFDLETPQRRSFAQVCADKPLRPAKPQEPCDVGMFGDSALQVDLMDLVHKAP